MWKHYPWLAGLALAPLLYGGFSTAAQSLIGLLFAVSLFFLIDELGGAKSGSLIPRWLIVLSLAVLLLPLLPLPVRLAGMLSPERFNLAKSFPVDLPMDRWICLAVSPAGCVKRFWELSLCLGAALLGRLAARGSVSRSRFCDTLFVTVLLLALSEFWRRSDGLGPLRLPLLSAGGTFANRNHFANWIYVASLFLFGSILRSQWPLHHARTSRIPKRSWVVSLVGITILLIALAAAVLSGSRGGMISGAVGSAVWICFLKFKSRDRGRWVVLMTLGLAGLFVLIAQSQLLIERLRVAGDNSSVKARLWKDASVLVARFPVFGVGLGGFAPAYSHYKTTFGENTVLHVENDYWESLMECGWAGVLVAVLLAAFFFPPYFRELRRERFDEPELLFGCAAALAAFSFHALAEFVSHIPANALLGSSLFGFMAGLVFDAGKPGPTTESSVRGPHLALGILLVAGASFTGYSAYHFYLGRTAPDVDARVRHLRQSVDAWPFQSEDQLTLTRAEIRHLRRQFAGSEPDAEIARIRAQLSRSIRWDPLNWQLHLERVWLDLLFSTNQPSARAEAFQVVRLNPLQWQIPSRFAQYFATNDASLALQFLQETKISSRPEILSGVLELAWEIERDTARLWQLTPLTTDGLLRLGDFGLRHQLNGLAFSAFQQLSNRLDRVSLAERYLKARRPDAALQLLEGSSSSGTERLLRARILFQQANYPAAMREAEAVCRANPRFAEMTTPASTVPGSSTAPAEGVFTPLRVETLYQRDRQQLDARDVERVARDAPDNLRIWWIWYQIVMRNADYAKAAEIVIEIADKAGRI